MIKETMKAAVCDAPGRIIMRDLAIPRPGPGEVLVEVVSSGICGDDLRAYWGKYPGVNYPIILGHEFAGVVADLGKGVENFQIEDEVICEPMFPCGECNACLQGEYNLCSSLLVAGYQVPGSFAEYAVIKSAMLYNKDESLSFVEAALVEPLAVAINGVKLSGAKIGDIAVVLGSGSIGLLTLQVAQKSGAKVIVSDISDEKLHIAANLGADYTVNPESNDSLDLVMAFTGNRGADIIFECAGNQKTISQSFELVRKGGTIVLIGWTGNEVDEIPLTKVTHNQIKLIGSTAYCRDFPTAIDLILSRKVNVSSMISHEFRLSQLSEAFEEMSQNRNDIIKGIVTYD